MKSRYLFPFLALFVFLGACVNAQESKTENEAAKKEGIRNVNVAEFAKKMEEEGVVILDVRTPGEISKGKIEGALEIDIRSEGFDREVQQLDKSKTYLVYCQSGGRSATACTIMAEAGFKQLFNLEDGYTAWSANRKEGGNKN